VSNAVILGVNKNTSVCCCRMDAAALASSHFGSVVVSGEAEVRTESPLVCNAAGMVETKVVFSPPLFMPIVGANPNISCFYISCFYIICCYTTCATVPVYGFKCIVNQPWTTGTAGDCTVQ
jgi:hypothetical protein